MPSSSPRTRIDLHCHSTASDGVDTPTEVVARAARLGVQVLALTDHDTLEGRAEAAAAAARHGVRLVPGAELSGVVDDLGVHVVSYFFDEHDPEIVALLARARSSRVDRARAMVDRLAVDHPITWDDVLAQTGGATRTVGRPHLADALVAHGVVPDRESAFAGVLHRSSPYYVATPQTDAVRLVEVVRAAGGVPVLAHPFASLRGRLLHDGQIERLAAAGLAGLEAWHPQHRPDEVARARALADRLGLVATGSSDYHGAVRPCEIGQCTTPVEVLAEIEAQAGPPRTPPPCAPPVRAAAEGDG